MKTAKAAVVTGAAGGIGTALCEELCKAGYLVWGIDQNEVGLKTLSENMSKVGKKVVTRSVDITDEAAITKLLEEIAKESHHLSVWVNNAGISGVGHFDKQDTKLMKRVIDVNLTAILTISRLVLDRMEYQGDGVIVNIASVAGHIPSPYLAAYSASKHGVVGFTRAVESELQMKNSGVRTLLVCPGFIDTPMIKEGGKFAFPEWLSFSVASPQVVARAVARAVASGKREIYPSWNGKLLLLVNKVVPGFRNQGTKLLNARSFKDYILNRFSA